MATMIYDYDNSMISFGGGVNSVAMTILLVNEGYRGPIVFADTGGEHPETYCYLDYFEREWLKPHGLKITRVSLALRPELYDEKRLGGLDGVHSLEEYCLKRGIIPLLAVRWCSIQFKRVPLENWRDAHGLTHTFIGIADDEAHRVRPDPHIYYPLADRLITRQECQRIIQRTGLDIPRKSGCFFCPGQRLSQWRDLCLNYPELYERAIVLEDNASGYNQKHATLDPHSISLRDHRRRRWQGQQQMDLSEWLPCACRL